MQRMKKLMIVTIFVLTAMSITSCGSDSASGRKEAADDSDIESIRELYMSQQRDFAAETERAPAAETAKENTEIFPHFFNASTLPYLPKYYSRP